MKNLPLIIIYSAIMAPSHALCMQLPPKIIYKLKAGPPGHQKLYPIEKSELDKSPLLHDLLEDIPAVNAIIDLGDSVAHKDLLIILGYLKNKNNNSNDVTKLLLDTHLLEQFEIMHPIEEKIKIISDIIVTNYNQLKKDDSLLLILSKNYQTNKDIAKKILENYFFKFKQLFKKCRGSHKYQLLDIISAITTSSTMGEIAYSTHDGHVKLLFQDTTVKKIDKYWRFAPSYVATLRNQLIFAHSNKIYKYTYNMKAPELFIDQRALATSSWVGSIKKLLVSPDNTKIITVDNETFVHLHSIDSATENYIYWTIPTLKHIALANNVWAVSVNEGTNIRLWNTRSYELHGTIKNISDISSLALSSEGDKIFVGTHIGTSAGKIHLWDISNTGFFKILAILETTLGFPRNMLVTSNNKKLIYSSNKDINIVDIHSRKSIASLTGHEDTITHLAWAEDAHKLISVSHDKSLRIWDLSIMKELEKMSLPELIKNMSY